ncbi:hypothetical protein OHA72_10375 [Dactylosporangium sp. NBC_01737]|uniref:hypothetical protein n=1 Tax=Dactylosporangium sp. NBC_01737 TaxID=2975959 RepID=UPI002E0D5652|nr:hypothetical protein OHA72_10375 [Dactylosporangium sp. NBC_01737]
MGTWAFETYADGEDADTAFDTTRRDAAREHGHRYSGTIADKDSYVIITDTITDLDEAEELAATLMEQDDPRIADKCGPAGAIPVRRPTRTVHVDDLTAAAPPISSARPNWTASPAPSPSPSGPAHPAPVPGHSRTAGCSSVGPVC